jgi:FkbM family methyltransferase
MIMLDFVNILIRVTRKIEYLFAKISKKLVHHVTVSRLIKRGTNDRDLYKTNYGNYYWLDKKKYIDNLIIENGVFEDWGTKAVKKLINKNDTVLDVGANIGYYSVIFSKLVGQTGKVYSFEPLAEYNKILKQNLEVNNIQNCEVINYGLSNLEQELSIYVNDSSATIHAVNDDFERIEKIRLITLDKFVYDNNIKKIDFIKIDVDGHEPAVLEGACKVIKNLKPIVLLEISHLHYLKYGITVWDFYSMLKKKGLYIYTEVNLEEIKSKNEFLTKCCNFNHSTNIIISYDRI